MGQIDMIATPRNVPRRLDEATLVNSEALSLPICCFSVQLS